MSNGLKTMDLCGRLPYGVFCHVPDYEDRPVRVTTVNALLDCVVFDGDITPLMYDDEDWLAYLRPMDSMTEEEREEYQGLCLGDMDIDRADALMDWLHTYHFDYRGLIGKGLALEAPKDMYV